MTFIPAGEIDRLRTALSKEGRTMILLPEYFQDALLKKWPNFNRFSSATVTSCWVINRWSLFLRVRTLLRQFHHRQLVTSCNGDVLAQMRDRGKTSRLIP